MNSTETLNKTILQAIAEKYILDSDVLCYDEETTMERVNLFNDVMKKHNLSTKAISLEIAEPTNDDELEDEIDNHPSNCNDDYDGGGDEDCSTFRIEISPGDNPSNRAILDIMLGLFYPIGRNGDCSRSQDQDECVANIAEINTFLDAHKFRYVLIPYHKAIAYGEKVSM